MGIYTGGGTVFTAATTDWSHGLQGNDAVVESITRNVLNRLSEQIVIDHCTQDPLAEMNHIMFDNLFGMLVRGICHRFQRFWG